MCPYPIDPAVRATAIAEREAEAVWQQTGDLDLFYKTLIGTFNQVLAELVSPEFV